MAGAKGSGLSLMIEILCSVLLGNPNIAPALAGGEGGGFNGMVIAIDPAGFGEPSGFIEQVRQLADAIHGLEPAPDANEVLLPGERGYRSETERRREGIPVADGTLKRLQTLATELRVTPPTAST
jgi:ureidoglycolate dehydrogenase (NAD+)